MPCPEVCPSHHALDRVLQCAWVTRVSKRHRGRVVVLSVGKKAVQDVVLALEHPPYSARAMADSWVLTVMACQPEHQRRARRRRLCRAMMAPRARLHPPLGCASQHCQSDELRRGRVAWTRLPRAPVPPWHQSHAELPARVWWRGADEKARRYVQQDRSPHVWIPARLRSQVSQRAG